MSQDPASGFVILHFGPMGVSAMSAAAELAGAHAVIDPNAARMSGASFAFGAREHLEALKSRLEAGAVSDAEDRYAGLAPEAIRWLATGERGLSSEAIFTRLTGIDLEENMGGGHHPHDPGDLRRCRLLLESVPGFELRIHEMAGVSEQWSRLVARWDEICETMDAEIPDWRTAGGHAPKTYALMKRVLGNG